MADSVVPASMSTEAAQDYQRTSNMQDQMGRELFQICSVSMGVKVLDLGCGTGNNAAVLSEMVGEGGTVTAIDPDSERIELAKKTYEKPNLKYLVGDDQNFPGENYDLVFSNVVVHWIIDKEALFKRVYEKLRPGGRFAFSNFNGQVDFGPEIRNALAKFVGSDFYPQFINEKLCFVSTEKYKDLAAMFEFTISEFLSKPILVKWESLQELLDWFYGVSHGMFDISKVDKDAMKQYMEQNNIRSFSVTFDSVYIVMTK